jgi:[ribosomal protein S5]-alanine N-acetyltransferase
MEQTNPNIQLRPFFDTDTAILAQLCNNRKIWDHVRDYFPFPYTEEDAVTFIKRCQAEAPRITFAIEYKNALAGCIGLVPQTDVYKRTAEIGYWIGEPYWGLGIATQSVRLVTQYGFDQLALVRIHAGVFDFNKASQRVLEKAGFELECIAEKSVYKNGFICDEYRYKLISKTVNKDKT